MTTINLTVTGDDDDARESDSGGSFSMSVTELAADANTSASSRFNSGFRFANVTIDQGATIDAADFQVAFTNTPNDSPRDNLFFEDIDDAPNFTDVADVTSRTPTSESVAWSDDDVGVATYVSAPDMATPLQEVVDRAGWASGQAVVVLMKGFSTEASVVRPYSVRHASNFPAKLDIDYTAGGGGGAPGLAKNLPLLGVG